MLLVVAPLMASCETSPIPTKTVGDFCDINDPLDYRTTAVADFVVDNDPDLADGIAAHNLYGEDACGWVFGSH